MKKSVIKRRKRVVPAAQGTQASGIDAANDSVGSPQSDHGSPSAETTDQRGTMNSDGSINLGFRTRDDQRRALLPEPIRTQNSQPLPVSDFTAYASTSSAQGHQHEHLESLNDDNRLPPMNSYPSPTQRQQRSSLSPSSFLSPSRKRSFSATEIEQRPSLAENGSQPKRLSSIKSILNPGFSDVDASDIDPSLRTGGSGSDRRSPGRFPTMGSPNMSSGYATSPSGSAAGSALNSGRDPQSESERSKLERREMLQREAQRMREELKAKERELAELGLSD